MHVIIFSKSHGKAQSIKLGMKSLILGVVALVCIGLLGAWLSYYLGKAQVNPLIDSAEVNAELVGKWQEELQQQALAIAQLKKQKQQQVDALTLRIGELQARLLRIDALGQRLSSVAGLEEGEFDFYSQPALGGPESAFADPSFTMAELTQTLQQLEEQVASRSAQLRLMDEVLVNDRFEREQFIAGRPIRKGWLSSHYGYRTDPFNGRRAWHAGVDFAGKDGSDIIAVAGGVVTYAADRHGYGNLVEINHGGGLVTRYAHCKEISVNVGDVVQKGQVVAMMGSTGRSTGPHVHFEVLKNGKSVNPAKFIHRASR